MTFVDGLLELVAPLLLLLLISVMLSEMHPALGCLALAGAFGLGAARRPLWMPLILAIGAAALNLMLLLSRWMVGFHDAGLTAAGHLLALFGMISVAGWYAGRLTSQIARGAIQLAYRAMQWLALGKAG